MGKDKSEDIIKIVLAIIFFMVIIISGISSFILAPCDLWMKCITVFVISFFAMTLLLSN